MWKKILLVCLTLVVSVMGFGAWFFSLLDQSLSTDMVNTKPQDIEYLRQGIPATRGKILAVVTSSQWMGETDKKTGFELTELARAYYVFQANGFSVDIASPKGGNPSAILDDDDMAEFDYAFLNDPIAQQKVTNSLVIDSVDPNEYQAVYFVGGKGAMFDFPNNQSIQNIVRSYMRSEKVIGAVCHGPAALVNVTFDDGTSAIANKKVSSFTNKEELFLIPNAKEVFPFLLQDKLTEQGGRFIEGALYLEQVSRDGNLVTGQNPWSVWKLAESMIEQLGYQPIARQLTAEESAINILSIYEKKGISEAKNELEKVLIKDNKEVSRNLIAIHGIVAMMQFDLGKALNLVRLTSVAKDLSVEDGKNG